MTGSPIQEFIEGLGFQYFRILSSSTQDPKTCKRDLGDRHQYGLTFIVQKWYLSLGLIFPWKALTTWLLLGQEKWEAWKDPWQGICYPTCTLEGSRELWGQAATLLQVLIPCSTKEEEWSNIWEVTSHSSYQETWLPHWVGTDLCWSRYISLLSPRCWDQNSHIIGQKLHKIVN